MTLQIALVVTANATLLNWTGGVTMKKTALTPHVAGVAGILIHVDFETARATSVAHSF